jgi:ribonuclease D
MADPAVLKVLHGGANDIAWLQRDAHVYLVNIFDTERAAQVRVKGVAGSFKQFPSSRPA